MLGAPLQWSCSLYTPIWVWSPACAPPDLAPGGQMKGCLLCSLTSSRCMKSSPTPISLTSVSLLETVKGLGHRPLRQGLEMEVTSAAPIPCHSPH